MTDTLGSDRCRPSGHKLLLADMITVRYANKVLVSVNRHDAILSLHDTFYDDIYDPVNNFDALHRLRKVQTNPRWA